MNRVSTYFISQLSKWEAEVLPYKSCWIRPHFHDWIDYHGVAFSIELLEWGRTFSDFWGKTARHIYGLQTFQNVCTVGEK